MSKEYRTLVHGAPVKETTEGTDSTEKKEKKPKKEKKTKKQKVGKNRLGIIEDTITMSSIMDHITLYDISGKREEFRYFTKHGKIKKFKPKKDDTIIISIPEEYSVYRKIGDSDVYEQLTPYLTGCIPTTSGKECKYAIPFQVFYKAIEAYMISSNNQDPDSYQLFVTRSLTGGDKKFIMSACGDHGSILDKYGRAYIKVRYSI